MTPCDLTRCYSIDGACSRRLKLKCEKLLCNFAFNFNLCRYILGADLAVRGVWFGRTVVRSAHQLNYYQAGAYTRPLFGST